MEGGGGMVPFEDHRTLSDDTKGLVQELRKRIEGG
jgi:hypothetical protein